MKEKINSAGSSIEQPQTPEGLSEQPSEQKSVKSAIAYEKATSNVEKMERVHGFDEGVSSVKQKVEKLLQERS